MEPRIPWTPLFLTPFNIAKLTKKFKPCCSHVLFIFILLKLLKEKRLYICFIQAIGKEIIILSV